MAWYFRVKANEFDDLFPQIKVTEFKQLPIKIDDNQDKYTVLVDEILLYAKKGDYEKDYDKLEKVSGYLNEIDKLVYKLYGLTNEEIIIVEEAAKPVC